MAQLVSSGRFQKYDFGKEKNLVEYKNESNSTLCPPEIKINCI